MRIGASPLSLRAASATISTRFLAALLMFHIWLGYCVPTISRIPRVESCGTPSTLSKFVINGNCVGIPPLRWWVWVLVAGLRSGIGVGADGVTVRSALGWTRRVSWQDVTGFRALEMPRWKAPSGARMVAVAVVGRDRRPLTTAACFFQPWTKKSGYQRVDEMRRALETERSARPSSPDLVL